MTDVPTDNRPYPRTELCPCCRAATVDVVGPGDEWSMCHLCHLALMDEYTTTLADALRWDEADSRPSVIDVLAAPALDSSAVAYIRDLMIDPRRSDCTIADAISSLRRERTR